MKTLLREMFIAFGNEHLYVNSDNTVTLIFDFFCTCYNFEIHLVSEFF